MEIFSFKGILYPEVFRQLAGSGRSAPYIKEEKLWGYAFPEGNWQRIIAFLLYGVRQLLHFIELGCIII